MIQGILLAALLGLAAPAAAAETGDEGAATDWPAMITRLQREASERPGAAATRQELATAYNNYGVSLGNEGQWAQAIQQLQEALRLDRDNARFQDNLAKLHLNQAHEAYGQHQLAQALQAVERALELDPELAHGYALLGEIQYQRQQLKDAKAAWERAVALDPSLTAVAARLEQVDRELPVESTFERLSQAYFDVRYDEELQRPAGFDVRDALLRARREVGSDFAYWPKYKLIVLVYRPEQFHGLGHPDWIAGKFDGKIRMPLPGAQMPPALVTQILFHEYTHALIHDLAKGRCPAWLNEGLAEYEGRSQLQGRVDRLAEAVAQDQLIPWQELSAAIGPDQPAERMALAYEQSYSLAAYLIDRYAFWRIRRILKALGEGQPWESVLASELRIKLPRLESYWRQSLPDFLAAHS